MESCIIPGASYVAGWGEHVIYLSFRTPQYNKQQNLDLYVPFLSDIAANQSAATGVNTYVGL